MGNMIKVTTTRSENTLMFIVKDALLPYGKSIPLSQPGAAKLHPVAEVLMAVPGVDSAWIMGNEIMVTKNCLLYTSPSPRDLSTSRMPSSA